MRNVCGKFLPLLLGLFALGDVHDEQHGGVACAVLGDRAGREGVSAAVFLHFRVCAAARERGLDRLRIGGVPTECQVIPGGAVAGEKAADGVVCEQNVARRGEQHEPLVHAGGDVIKLGLTAAQLVHLHADAAVLAVDAVQQGGKLVICRVFQRVVQVERGNRREKDMGQAAREQGRNEQRQQHHEHNPRRRARKRPKALSAVAETRRKSPFASRSA